MAKKKQTEVESLELFKPSSIIKPEMVFNDEPHLLQEMFDDGSFPIIKSVGVVSVPGGNYVSCLITTQGTKVLEIKVGTPNLRNIAIDEYKINYVTHIIDQQDEGGMF